MTTELKTDMDDVKDFAHQAKLEGKIQARNLKDATLTKVAELSGKEPTTQEKIDGAKVIATDKLHNAQDLSKQVGLEIQKKSRDTKLAIEKSSAGQAIAGATESITDKIKDVSLDAREALSSDPSPSIPLERMNLQQERQQREEDKLAEAKRQKLVDDTKSAAHNMKENIVAASHSIAEKLEPYANQAKVALGTAALAAKDKLDDFSASHGKDDASAKPTTKENIKLSENRVDISSVQNARNDELAHREQVARDLESAKQKPLSQKVSEGVKDATEAVKGAFTAATTDAPQPLFVAKTAENGVDISHLENPQNATLAAREEERLRAEKIAVQERQKGVIGSELKSNASSAGETLKGQLFALGDSLLRASQKAGEVIVDQYHNATAPAPVEHQRTSVNGVDVSAVENHPSTFATSSSKSASAATTAESTVPQKDLKTRAIEAVLDAGVAAREKGAVLSEQAYVASGKAQVKANELSEAAQVKGKELAHDANVAAKKVQDKITPNSTQ